MSGSARPCGFPPCVQQAVATVTLAIDGCPLELPSCERHLRWLHRYAEGDAAVLLLEEVPEEA